MRHADTFRSLLGNGVGLKGAAALAEAAGAHPGSLRRLVGMDLCRVDTALPMELRDTTNGPILDYYRDLQSSAAGVFRRCRVMLLGNGRTGKTTLAATLAARLIGLKQVEGRSEIAGVTHGVHQRTCLKAVELMP